MTVNRVYLENGYTIKLVREGNCEECNEWMIGEVLGEGASSVCYFAKSGNKTGRLKQFNPIGKTIDDKSINDFLSAYRTLDLVKNRNPRYAVLNNYIPYYEILFEKDDVGNCIGTYIWTPDDKTGKNFEEYLNEVRANPCEAALKKLYDIISVISTLADGICLLHMAGLLHLDIKPSNFLVTYNSRFELNTSNISMFDLNSLYSIETDVLYLAGTAGFTAPEVEYGRADNRSDIYSLGALLFNAVVITEDIPEIFYNGSYFEKLNSLVEKSKLISGLETNFQKEITEAIVTILKKCLDSSPAKRYDYCELLVNDLEKLKKILWAYCEINNEEDFAVPNTKSANNKMWILGLTAVAAVAGLFFGISMYQRSNKIYDISTDSAISLSENIIEEISENVIETISEDISYETDEEVSETVYRTPIEAGLLLFEEIESKKDSVNPTDRIITASAEMMGNNCFSFEKDLLIPSGVTLILPDDISYRTTSMDDCLIVDGTLICNSKKLFKKTVSYGNAFVRINSGGTVILDGIEIYGGSGDYWTSAFITKRDDMDPSTLYLDIRNNTYISSSYQDFVDSGLDYYFGYGSKPVGVYFDDSDEPYDVYESTVCDRLQLEIEQYFFTGGEVVVDYPVTVEKYKDLWVHEGITLILKEGAEIHIEDGAYFYIFGTIIEDGGHIVNRERTVVADNGVIISK